jgi:hypothetical protein
MEKIIPYKLMKPDTEIAATEQLFKAIFGKSVSIQTVNIRGGKTSSIIYVPKEFKDKVATVIIWDKEVKKYEGDADAD